MNKVFSDKAWEEYQYWVANDKRILKRVNELIRDIERAGHAGMGRPEALKHDLEGFWSRRITEEHRLVYSIDGENIYIAKCLKHYK
jgi:toxin YoeB